MHFDDVIARRQRYGFGCARRAQQNVIIQNGHIVEDMIPCNDYERVIGEALVTAPDPIAQLQFLKEAGR